MALGSSLGNAVETFAQAEAILRAQGLGVVKKSQNLKNPALGGVAQNEFTNGVWQLEFSETVWERWNWVLLPRPRRLKLKAKKLLRILQRCENQLGRDRSVRWADRTLDLDILMFHDLVLSSKRLAVPHPEIPKRRFVLQPWAELVDKNFEIPKFGKLSDLIKNLN